MYMAARAKLHDTLRGIRRTALPGLSKAISARVQQSVQTWPGHRGLYACIRSCASHGKDGLDHAWDRSLQLLIAHIRPLQPTTCPPLHTHARARAEPAIHVMHTYTHTTAHVDSNRCTPPHLHGMCLATRSLAVGKHRAVVSVGANASGHKKLVGWSWALPLDPPPPPPPPPPS